MNTTIFRTEVREELLGIVREPTVLVFSVLTPVAFFALFATIFGGDGGFGVASLATYGAFGVLSGVMVNPGVSLADARDRGWLRVKRADGTPVGLTLSAKVAAALPYAVVTLAGITLVAGFTAGPLDTVQVLRVMGVLIVASLPFALFSLAVGAKFSVTGAVSVLNAVLIPSVILSGLWFPLEMLPTWLGEVAVFLPPYHLAQLALAQVEGGAVWGHIGYLVVFTIVGAITAALAYRSAEV